MFNPTVLLVACYFCSMTTFAGAVAAAAYLAVGGSEFRPYASVVLLLSSIPFCSYTLVQIRVARIISEEKQESEQSFYNSDVLGLQYKKNVLAEALLELAEQEVIATRIAIGTLECSRKLMKDQDKYLAIKAELEE